MGFRLKKCDLARGGLLLVIGGCGVEPFDLASYTADSGVESVCAAVTDGGVSMSAHDAGEGGLAGDEGASGGSGPADLRAGPDFLDDVSGAESVEDLYGDDWNDWADWASALDGEGWPVDDPSWDARCGADAGMEAESSRDEFCGNGVDDDCDGTVDEHDADRCIGGCDFERDGDLMCDPFSGKSWCNCFAGGPRGCGDGIVSDDEECDPRAPDALPKRLYSQAGQGSTQLQPYCTDDCKLDTLFAACGQRFYLAETQSWHIDFKPTFSRFGEDQETPYCDSGTVCDPSTFACMPSVGESFTECPELKRPAEEDTSEDAFVRFPYRSYPMVELSMDGGPRMCVISCRNDAECPRSVPQCYQQRCVVPVPPVYCAIANQPAAGEAHPECPPDLPRCVPHGETSERGTCFPAQER